MQNVSQSWKDIHKQTLLNESFVEISLDIADPDAMKDAIPSDNGSEYISDTLEVTSEVNTPVIHYGTLEQNGWVLDNSSKIIPINDYKDGGYIGDALSNDEGVFVEKIPTITIGFSKEYENHIPGITISWGTAYNEYAEHFIVTAYKDSDIVAQTEVVDNKSMKTIVTLDIANYNRIEVQILRWCLPNHRARVDEIFMGWHKIYTKTDLFSYSHKQTGDPISTSLPKMEIKFSVNNVDGSYNPYNPQGMSKYLIERQEIKTRYGLKKNDNTIEWVDGGVFYLSEWYAKQNGISADFVARDLLEFMSENYKDDITTITERSLYALAEQVLTKAEIPLNSDGTVKWYIDDSLKSIYTTAPLPDDTIANCLQMIANAGKCTIYPDRKGMLCIVPVNNELTDYSVDSFNSYSKAEITLSKIIKRVVVKVYSYSESGGIATTDVVKDINSIGETIVVTNPLITKEEQAVDLCEWISNYIKNRMTVRSDCRPDVRLDTFDVITNKNEYGSNNVMVTDIELNFNGAFHGIVEGKVI